MLHIAGLLTSLGFPPTDENLHDNVQHKQDFKYKI